MNHLTRRLAATLAAVAALALTACTGPTNTAPVSLAAAAEHIGCTGYTPETDPAPYADEWGNCLLDGSTVAMYLIHDEADYRAFVALTAEWGVDAAGFVRVGPVVAYPTLPEHVATITADLDGFVR